MDVSRAGVWLSGRDFTSLRPRVTTSAKAVSRNKRLTSNHYKVNEEKQSRAPAGRGCGSAVECFFSTTRLCVSPHPSTAKNNIKINHIWPVVTVKKEWGKGRDRFQVVQFLFYFWNFCPNSRLDRVNLSPINCQVKVECGCVKREQHSEGQWAD